MPNEVRNVLNAPNITGLIWVKFLVSIGPPGTRTANKTKERSKSADTMFLFFISINSYRIFMIKNRSKQETKYNYLDILYYFISIN